jgi:hypothetical protein
MQLFPPVLTLRFVARHSPRVVLSCAEYFTSADIIFYEFNFHYLQYARRAQQHLQSCLCMMLLGMMRTIAHRKYRWKQLR